ncbi:hypothetical protein [Cellulophaga sp. Hel_I_12]|uniref:hypothetical protein n=1 Tax=Cellulophaga sp. Hel_I_12 TaxID=1249972 RepID=UPI000645EB83|nr:hypothetical protein [Cellulophaga sp. Hel_I_12]
MESVNYIKHLNAVFLLFSKDKRLNPSHICLYMGLFQLWNNYHFSTSFYINRDEVMQLAKIGSKTTYHRCIKELHHWKYLVYLPSYNPFHGSKIKMFNFGTSAEQVVDPFHTNMETSSGLAMVSINKHNKTKKRNINENKLDQPKNEKEVVDFFLKENWTALEAKKFYNHYEGIGWRVGGKSKIVNWQATARNWVLKANEIKKEKITFVKQKKADNLMVDIHKKYNEPL